MKAYTDGACRCGNPGETSCAFAVFNSTGEVVHQFSTYLGPEMHTNNYAEYQGLLHLLRWAFGFYHYGLDIYCDSNLVVQQVLGKWKMTEKSLHLQPFQEESYALLVRGCHRLHHIKGHNGDPGNECVDKLCNLVLDEEFARRKNENKK